MATKMCDCNQGRLPCSCLGNGDCYVCSPGPARPFIKLQATKFTQQEMRERSPSGVIRMDGMMGKNFTTWFLIKCGLFGVAAAYLFDWVVVSMQV